MAASVVSNNVDCLSVVRSWVVPSPRCDTAWRVAALLVLMAKGVAATVKDSNAWSEAPSHPVIRINKPHRSLARVCSTGELFMDYLVTQEVGPSRVLKENSFEAAS
jgi:hypothetical protein